MDFIKHLAGKYMAKRAILNRLVIVPAITIAIIMLFYDSLRSNMIFEAMFEGSHDAWAGMFSFGGMDSSWVSEKIGVAFMAYVFSYLYTAISVFIKIRSIARGFIMMYIVWAVKMMILMNLILFTPFLMMMDVIVYIVRFTGIFSKKETKPIVEPKKGVESSNL
ncbi:hypothetical protein [Salisediminibacterium halotolerans]|uniref:hypothetical protein n=1 Tax=Salisediminibacterium halotolerans TaxID=517425 RepID=UPI000EAE67D9|nr:hypothetical protein [Salisediminibacterium halotolerans]RLJ72193.1 hypothetical protein BCL39_2084 [Actinophytocola xinjiangensis]RPE85406.1 hypothetical protein EDD67_2219 [Salisediminibacterium halotolerans]TWG33363.1 hypothetical protein BCL52_2081 [Salisediminibacterium halotolerans]GEL07109.1 hypothetical protein SHA02_05250 [Salisediminibacterium halotolerans]